jgi:hypothetical protein
VTRVNWVIVALLVAAGAALVSRYAITSQPTGLGYYALDEAGGKTTLSRAELDRRLADQAPGGGRIVFSWARTAGIWLAALLTLAIFSFLYRDNPFYKLAEHLFVGVSAAYWMTVAFWNAIVPNLLCKLFPRAMKFSIAPGTNLDEAVSRLAAQSPLAGIIDYQSTVGDGLTAPWWQLMDYLYLIPLVLGIMLLCRLLPRGSWIARWPLAFVVGTTAGLRMIGYLESDFVAQVRSTMLPLFDPVYGPLGGAVDWGRTFYRSMNNVLMVLGVACGLVYFFFSLEHRGAVARASRVGIWVLMITFGAGFAFTVMGRIALLVGRVEFLLIDWLNLAPG